MIKFSAKLDTFDKLFLGFSGGLDSQVLLDLLSKNLEYRKKLVAVYIDHGLNKNSAAWAKICEASCNKLAIKFQTYKISLPNKSKSSLEELARTARYNIFNKLTQSISNSCLLLAHHTNDQAETLLLQLFRGAGINGLAAMPEWGDFKYTKIYRPLLNTTRKILHNYALTNNLTWIEDESNQDISFDRNFLRHAIIPKLLPRWPGLINNIARSASHCASAKQILDSLITDKLIKIMDSKGHLDIIKFKNIAVNLQADIIRAWIIKLGFRVPSNLKLIQILNEVIAARNDATPVLKWQGCEIRRYANKLYAMETLPDTLGKLSAKLVYGNGIRILLKDKVAIKFRQGGEKIKLKNHHHSLKKLFQEWRIPPWERNLIPLIYINNKLACVAGYCISNEFKVSDEAVYGWVFNF